MDLFGRCLGDIEARARRALREHRREMRRAGDEVIESFVRIAEVLVDEDVPDSEVRHSVLDRVAHEDLARLLEACRGPARPLDNEGLDFLRGRVRAWSTAKRASPSVS